MAIKIGCACGRTLTVKDELEGKNVKCPACQKVLSVPKPKAKEESLDDDWELDDADKEDSDDEPIEAPAKSRGAKSSAVGKGKARSKGQGEKLSGSNRGLLIGLSAGGGRVKGRP